MMNSRSNSLTPRTCCNRRRAYGEGLRLPFINWERYPEDSPHWRANSFWNMPSRSSSSHIASRLSFTLGRGGGVGFISSVPSPGVAGRTGRGTHCFRPGCRGRGRSALRPLLPAHVFGLFCCPGRAGRQPGPSLSSRTADGRYQLVGQHPAVSGADGSSAAQPLIPATGPPECLCGTSGSARSDRPR